MGTEIGADDAKCVPAYFTDRSAEHGQRVGHIVTKE